MPLIIIAFYVTIADTENMLSYTVLSSLLEDPTTHDVTFKTADGGSLGAHRAIIAASSPVFHAMLYGKTKESKESEICLSSINNDMLKMIFTLIYTGLLQVNSDECPALLQAAHYFNIATLETKCGEMLVSTLDVHSNFSSVITFAIEHQLDLLFKQCLEFMEINADEVIQSLEFNTLPLRMILAFVKSSNLEVREIDLFLAVAKWLEHQENEISADDKEQVLQLVRYPLISLDDLLKKVRPSKLADQTLYTAALEYNNLPMSDICESEFSREQLTLRKYYFNFSSSPGLLIKHTAKGTVITLTKDTDENLLTMAEICPTTEKPVRFKIENYGLGSIMLGGYYKTVLYSNSVYCGNREMGEEGIIMLRDNFLTTMIGHNHNMMRVPVQNEDTCVICIFMRGNTNTNIVVKRL